MAIERFSTDWNVKSQTVQANEANFIWQGPWIVGRQYQMNEMVENDGSSWIALQSHQSSTTDEPGIGINTAAFWDLVAQIGATGAQGSGTAFEWLGTWDNGTVYQVDKTVEYLGSSYVSLQVTTAGVPPDTSLGVDWDLMAQKGTDGAPGGAGAPGAPGVPGADGTDGDGFDWLGSWSGGTDYKDGVGEDPPFASVVEYLGSSYVCILDVTGTNPVAGLGTFWELMASKGDTGNIGPAGPTGAGVVWLGNWTATTFSQFDAVHYRGHSWVANASTIGTEVPGVSAKWDVLVLGFQWEGTFSALTQYQEGDAVEHLGSSYYATADTITTAPPTAPWELLASKGEQGSAGAGSGDVLGPVTSTTGNVAAWDAPTDGTQLANSTKVVADLVTNATAAADNQLAAFSTTNKIIKDSTISVSDITSLQTDSHTHSNKAILDAITASYTTAEETKLLGIETAATADQTDAEIKIGYENNANTNAFDDAEQSKLAAITDTGSGIIISDAERALLVSGGDVVGPAGGTTDGEVTLFDDTTGKLVKTAGSVLRVTSTNVGINNATPTSPLHALGNQILFRDAADARGFQFLTDIGVGNEQFIGIGADAADATAALGIGRFGQGANIAAFDVRADVSNFHGSMNFNVADTTLYVNASSDRVGIGTITPSQKLDIRGGAIDLDEQVGATLGNPASDRLRLYAIDDATVTKLAYRDSAGNQNVLTTEAGQGDVSGPAGGTVANELALFSSTTGKVIIGAGNTFLAADVVRISVDQPASGSFGDVIGPASAITNRLASFPGTSGTLIADSGILINDVVTPTSTHTFTNKTFDANATGNSISNVDLTADVTGTLPVASGGSGRATAIAFSVLCGGTSTTAAHQSVVSVGAGGQVLTSNGAGALPTFQTLATAGDVIGPAGGVVDDEVAVYNSTTGKVIKSSAGLLYTSLPTLGANNTFTGDNTFNGANIYSGVGTFTAGTMKKLSSPTVGATTDFNLASSIDFDLGTLSAATILNLPTATLVNVAGNIQTGEITVDATSFGVTLATGWETAGSATAAIIDAGDNDCTLFYRVWHDGTVLRYRMSVIKDWTAIP